jgi:molybdopterin converting factor small subunit
LASYMVAVNNEYADDTSLVTQRDEIAIIPPVSGG